mgnify:CR=1 FL=1
MAEIVITYGEAAIHEFQGVQPEKVYDLFVKLLWTPELAEQAAIGVVSFTSAAAASEGSAIAISYLVKSLDIVSGPVGWIKSIATFVMAHYFRNGLIIICEEGLPSGSALKKNQSSDSARVNEFFYL